MTQTNQAPLVIKLGGAALSCTQTLSQLFGAIAAYQKSAQRQIAIVHGGGYLVDELMAKLQLETVKKNGLRVTPYDQIPVIAGALAGTANKLLQGQAIADGLNAVGLSLADGGLCLVEELDPELGAVGKASPGDSTLLQAVLNTGALPIISSIGLTTDGQMMNVNADQAAVAVAGALDAELVLLSDVSGVLDGKGHLIKTLSEQEADALIKGQVITDGMIVKVKAALEAANDLGRPIEVATWRYPEKLVQLFAGESIGTQFCLNKHQQKNSILGSSSWH
ncbi:acetylglutamate kinase [Vibrio sp. JCM 18905]|nr:acetylglutamate kinase [Vibrio sp. JCM 18905]